MSLVVWGLFPTPALEKAHLGETSTPSRAWGAFVSWGSRDVIRWRWPLIALKNVLSLSSGLCLGRKETMALLLKSCHQASQLLTGVGSERGRTMVVCGWEPMCVSLGKHPALKGVRWEMSVREWTENTHSGWMASDMSFIYLLNLELTHITGSTVHVRDSTEEGWRLVRSSLWGHCNEGCTLWKG